MKEERIYYISNGDGCIHNINDVEHAIIDEKSAYIGVIYCNDGFRIDEEVSLWTLKEVIRFFEWL